MNVSKTLLLIIFSALIGSRAHADITSVDTSFQTHQNPIENIGPKIPQKINIKPANLDDVKWLAHNIYFESRGQCLEGQYGVGIVTVNRLRHKNYPDTIEKVVKQQGQFAWFKARKNFKITDNTSFAQAEEIARNILEERGTLYNEMQKKLKNSLWFHERHIKIQSKNQEVVTVIGAHRFLKERGS